MIVELGSMVAPKLVSPHVEGIELVGLLVPLHSFPHSTSVERVTSPTGAELTGHAWFIPPPLGSWLRTGRKYSLLLQRRPSAQVGRPEIC